MQKLTEMQEKWLTALESGRFNQATGVLREEDRYCCLGVECELSHFGEWDDDGDRFYYDGSFTVLSESVAKLYGFRQEGSEIKPELMDKFYAAIVAAGYNGIMKPQLSAYNDAEATFAQIAAAIRACPEAVFVPNSQ